MSPLSLVRPRSRPPSPMVDQACPGHRHSCATLHWTRTERRWRRRPTRSDRRRGPARAIRCARAGSRRGIVAMAGRACCQRDLPVAPWRPPRRRVRACRRSSLTLASSATSSTTLKGGSTRASCRRGMTGRTCSRPAAAATARRRRRRSDASPPRTRAATRPRPPPPPPRPPPPSPWPRLPRRPTARRIARRSRPPPPPRHARPPPWPPRRSCRWSPRPSSTLSSVSNSSAAATHSRRHRRLCRRCRRRWPPRPRAAALGCVGATMAAAAAVATKTTANARRRLRCTLCCPRRRQSRASSRDCSS